MSLARRDRLPQDVHEPVSAPASYVAPHAAILDSTRRTYAGMVSAMDEAVGNVTMALKQAGYWSNTIFVVSNDNGGWLGYGGINYPYRGHKTTMYEVCCSPPLFSPPHFSPSARYVFLVRKVPGVDPTLDFIELSAD
jgi:arylsulfatase A-like enzyme